MRFSMRIGKRSNVAGRDHDLDAIIQCGKQCGLESAAAGSCNADSFAIYIRASEQVVNGAHSVPHLPTRQICAGKVGEIPQDRVFRADQVVAALLFLRVPELASLTLSDRVPADNEIPTPHQPLAKILIVNFSVGCVSSRHKNCGMRFAILRYVHKSGYIQTRADSGR